MKKINKCDVVFNSFEGNVRGLFSTDHILSCFNVENSERYKNILENENLKILFEDKELMSTIEQFFKNDLNISQTSRNSFMHRNTLLYRLEKIKSLTGLNIKIFEDAIVFSNLIAIKEYLT